MASSDPTAGIDLSSIEAEVSKLSSADLQAELLKFRVRQKVQQKKHYNPDNMKKYQARQRERMKLLKQKAIDLGLWDKINADAEAQAEAKIASEATDTVAAEDTQD